MIRTRALARRRRPPNRRRRGAVLILVIVLLVLMALMGIAYMATARTDRATAGQNITNTQVEVLVDGMINLAQGGLVRDLVHTDGSYRKLRKYDAKDDGYLHVDHAGTTGDRYLASRSPVRLRDLALPWDESRVGYRAGEVVNVTLAGGDAFYVCTADQTQTTNQPQGEFADPWLRITSAEGVAAGANTVVWPYASWLGSELPFGDPLGTTAGASQSKRLAIPTVFTTSGGRTYPAIRLFLQNQPASASRFQTFLGADADGDGVADSVLFPIRSAGTGGVDYYAAVRIVDHGSAVNPSIAYGPTNDQAPGDYLPAALDLPSMLRGGTAERDRLFSYISNPTWRFEGGGTSTPSQDPGPGLGGPFRTPAEAVWMQLGRRIDLPGSSSGPVAYRPLEQIDMASLLYRGVLLRTMDEESASATERLLWNSVRPVPRDGRSPNTPYGTMGNDIERWYRDHHDFDQTTGNRPAIRSLLVTRNGVSNAAPNLLPPPIMPRDLDDMALRASVNTAGFDELWRQYLRVMVENDKDFGAATRTHPNTGKEEPVLPFRDMARWPRGVRYTVDGDKVVRTDLPNISVPVAHRTFLRAAVAAANAVDLRDAEGGASLGENITSHTFSAPGRDGQGNQVAFEYTVYGNEPQPYITEVVVMRYDAAAKDPGRDYLAIELYNPNPVAIDMSNWRLAMMDRTQFVQNDASKRARRMNLVPIKDVGLGQIPPNGYLVIQNRDASAEITVAQGTGTPPLTMPELTQAQGREVVLIRPLSKGTPSQEAQLREMVTWQEPAPPEEGEAPAPPPTPGAEEEEDPTIPVQYQAIKHPKLWAPLDQFDMTEWKGNPSPKRWFHYARSTSNWEWVWPGRYSAYRPGHRNVDEPDPPIGPDGRPVREFQLALDPAFRGEAQAQSGGTLKALWRYEGVESGSFAPPNEATLGGSNGTTVTSQTRFSIPLNTRGSFGQHDRYPYGGFARDGDILAVPFIGAYLHRVVENPVYDPQTGELQDPTPHEFWEYNSITMDAAMADDADELNEAWAGGANGGTVAHNNAREAVGRFVPFVDPNEDKWAASYAWALDLFDHLGVHASQTDHQPESPPDSGVSPRGAVYQRGPIPQGPAGDGFRARHAGNTDGKPPADRPEPYRQAWRSGWDAAEREGRVPVQGLVNINTAPWRVIAALPLLPRAPEFQGGDANNNGVADNVEALAKAIVKYRESHGPFRSVFDLNRVPGYPKGLLETPEDSQPFQLAIQNLKDENAEVNDAFGDFDPPGAGTDGMNGDYKERMLMLTRISAMVTTRSDTFTMYVLVQGWRDAETSNAELVAERRAAVVLDRSRVNGRAQPIDVWRVPQD